MRQYGCTRSQRKQRPWVRARLELQTRSYPLGAVNDAMGRLDTGRFRAAELSYQVDRLPNVRIGTSLGRLAFLAWSHRAAVVRVGEIPNVAGEMVGRDQELVCARCWRRLSRARQQRWSRAEPGIGKTTLLAVAERMATGFR
jgi:hypothetical protein